MVGQAGRSVIPSGQALSPPVARAPLTRAWMFASENE
jgi:hypothetical protein